MTDKKPTKGTEAPRKNADSRVDELDRKMDALQSSLAEILTTMKKAKNAPVTNTKLQAEPRESLDHTAVFTPDNQLVGAPRGDVTDPLFKEKMERMKFDAERVRIRVEHTFHEAEISDTRFLVSVNGMPMVFEEGKEFTVPRAYVEVLYRTMHTDVGCKEIVNHEGGRDYEYPQSTKQRRPISILEDRNPRSGEWIRSLIAQRH